MSGGGREIDLGGLGASKQAVLYTLARAGGTAWASQLKNTLKRRYGEPSGAAEQAFEFLERRDLIAETGNQYLEYELTDAGAAALRRDAQRRMSAVETIGVNSQDAAEVEG